MSRASCRILTGSPMSSTNTWPLAPMAPAWITSRAASGMVMKKRVIPKFKEQIARGGPITVTHPDITRFFMTIPEAARLVIQAGAIGASGQVFVLDMGEPVRILQLARDMIRLTGRTLEEIPIVYTGLRPGEKLYVEQLADADTTLPTPFARLRIARLQETRSERWLTQLTDAIVAMGSSGGDAHVRAWLQGHVKEYSPA